ncbi:hypothetical protein M404DRAFT_999566 [Pisolithus tinctorius Marx 270]|uniref:Uncharacterized protein n=1 Tax=Pisolithus tinctorius Marx 270 TaxID=870435 RepID=A0A0C3PDI6_PISTI|nr:hypothetical protein M404DRAFT_999566 [Pisolithus tinctorius Marx 270]
MPADEAARLRDERLKRKGSKSQGLRNRGKRGPDIPRREIDDQIPGQRFTSQDVHQLLR